MKRIITTLALVIAISATINAQKLPGSADSSFAKNGFGFYNVNAGAETPQACVVDNAGFIWIGVNSANDILVKRLQPNGDNDPTFANNGTLTIDLNGAMDRISDMALLPNGEVVLVGYTDVGQNRDLLVSRIKKDGSLDMNFGKNGHSILDLSGNHDFGHTALIDKDGRILAGGNVLTNSGTDLFLARLKDNGDLDSTFSVDGVTMFDIEQKSNSAIKVIENLNGGYYVLGHISGTNEAYVVAFTDNGNGSLQFNNKVYFTYQHKGAQTIMSDILLDKNGDFVMLGGFQGVDNWDGLVARFKKGTGALDLTFNTTGYSEYAFDSGNKVHDYHMSMYLQDDSMLLISGYSVPLLGENSLYTLRLQHDGQKDTTYGNLKGVESIVFDKEFVSNYVYGMVKAKNNDQMLIYGMTSFQNDQNTFVYAFNRIQRPPNSGTNGLVLESTAVKVYPNPASRRVHIEMYFETPAKYQLRSLQGHVVQEGSTTGEINFESDLLNGLYFLTFENEGTHYLSKIIIAN